MELEYHGKLEFPKLEFPISGRSLYISKIVINYKIFLKTVILPFWPTINIYIYI